MAKQKRAKVNRVDGDLDREIVFHLEELAAGYRAQVFRRKKRGGVPRLTSAATSKPSNGCGKYMLRRCWMRLCFSLCSIFERHCAFCGDHLHFP